MMHRPALDHPNIRIYCLIQMYVEFMRDGVTEFTPGWFHSHVRDVPTNVFGQFLEKMRQEGEVRFVPQGNGQNSDPTILPLSYAEVANQSYEITDLGIANAEALGDDHFVWAKRHLALGTLIAGSLLDEDGPIPAADRNVEITDNQRSALLSETDKLRSEVSRAKSHNFPDADETLAEIAAFELLISSPRVSEELMEKFLRKTFLGLARRFKDTALGIVALKIIDLGAALLGLSIQ